MASTVMTRRPSVGGVGARAEVGLRQRKKARLRQQIIETSIKLFRKQGYEETRIDQIVQALEISQPTFFRYFPTKDAVLREMGERGYACICEHLRSELSSKAGTDHIIAKFTNAESEVESSNEVSETWEEEGIVKQACATAGPALDGIASAQHYDEATAELTTRAFAPATFSALWPS